MTILEPDLWSIVKPVAKRYGLNPYLMLAIAQQECEKNPKNSNEYMLDYARLEQGFYRRYTVKHEFATTTEILLAASYGAFQVMGQSLLELGWFYDEFQKQSEQYKKFHVNPTGETNIPKALNRYCVSPVEQVDTACRWLDRKIKLLKVDASEQNWNRILLAWNGGANPSYGESVIARIASLKQKYQL